MELEAVRTIAQVEQQLQHELPSKSDVTFSPLRHYCAGVFAGCCLTLVGHPLERLNAPPPACKAMFPGARIPQKTFLGRLYSGVTMPLLISGQMVAICFSTYGACKHYLQSRQQHNISLVQIALAGTVSGAAASAVMGLGKHVRQTTLLIAVHVAAEAVKHYNDKQLRSLFRSSSFGLSANVFATAA